ncbi:MAG TPA: S-layer protein, partial [Gemmataceae bacterium]
MRTVCVVLCLVFALPAAGAAPVNFENDVLPVLTRAGCNAGACHGKARGQNGFQLSLLAFDPEFDYAALVKEARGRRVFPAAPEQSLLLRKATARMPHGGGKRLTPGDGMYEVLLEWVRQGVPRTTPNAPALRRVTVEPTEVLLAYHAEQPLKVTAHYSDGSTRDVTKLATYQSNESAYAAVDENGVIKAGPLPGEAAVMSRYMNHFAVTQVIIPFPGEVDPKVYQSWPRDHFIDRLVAQKWEQLRLTPSDVADDATFLRRAHL